MDLPSEIYVKIFSYLDHEELSVVCMSVCRHWRTIAQDPSFWRDIKFQNYFNERMIEVYLQLPFIWEVVATLELVEGQEIPSIPLPNLQTLVVSRFNIEKDSERIQLFPSLTSLRIKCEIDHETVMKLQSSKILLRNLKVDIEALYLRVVDYIDDPMKTLTAARNLTSRCNVERINLELNMQEDSLKRQEILEERLLIVPKTRFLHTPHFTVLQDFSLLTHVYLFWITREQAFQVLPATCPNLKCCELGRIEDGDMPSYVSPFPSLEELNVLHCYMPEDVLFKQVLTVWNNLKCLSVDLRSDLLPKLNVISRENPELTRLCLSTSPSKSRLRLFHDKVTFPALKTLELIQASGHPVLELMFLPVLSTLPVPATAKDSNLDLSCFFPSVERVYLESDSMRTVVRLLKPICQPLKVVHAQHARMFPKGLSGLRGLVDMCSELTELYLRVEPIDLEIFFQDLSGVVKSLKKLKTLRLLVIFQSFNNEKKVLTDQILRECFRPANIVWEAGRHNVSINFFPPALQMNLSSYGFCSCPDRLQQ